MLRLIFVVDAWVAGAFGAGLVFAPGLLFNLYGIHTSDTGEFLARVLGAFVLGQVPILWGARDHTATAAGLAITRGHALVDVAATIVCGAATLRGLMNGAGWIIVALFAGFGAGRVYYGFLAAGARQPASAAVT